MRLLTVYDLMQKVAPKLAGRKIIFRLGDPPTKTALGTTSVNRDGVPVVIVRSDLGEHTLATFLHELAHIRLGHSDKMVRSDTQKKPAYSVTVTPAQRVQPWENQADALRDRWLHYGKAHADPTLPGDEGILWALLEYKEY